MALDAIGEATFGLARAPMRNQIVGRSEAETSSGRSPLAPTVKTALFRLLHLAPSDTDNAILVDVCGECSKKDNGELLEIEYRDCRKMGPCKEQNASCQSLRAYMEGW